MSAAQLSLLRRIDELRRCHNPEAAETWQAVYLKVYGGEVGPGCKPDTGFSAYGNIPDPDSNPLE